MDVLKALWNSRKAWVGAVTVLLTVLLNVFAASLGLAPEAVTQVSAAIVAAGLAVIGGIALGVFVTHYSFGEWWTGIPVGNDITDSKTLIALVSWIAAAVAVGRSRLEKAWVVLAALVMLVIFAIPHSWTASEPLHSALDAAGTAVTAPADRVSGVAAGDSAAAR